MIVQSEGIRTIVLISKSMQSSVLLPYTGPYSSIICPFCDNHGKFYCKGCYNVAYCSKKCQKQHRKEHKDVCDLIDSQVLANRCLVIFKQTQLIHYIVVILRHMLKDRPNAPTICVVFLQSQLNDFLLEVICHEPVIQESTQNKVRLIIPHPTIPKKAINTHMDYTDSVPDITNIITTPLYDHIKGLSDGKLAIRVNNKINNDYMTGRDYELIIRNLVVKAVPRSDTQEKRDGITSRRNLLPAFNQEVLVDGTPQSSPCSPTDIDVVASE